jgi:biopolymer transport protein ExbB
MIKRLTWYFAALACLLSAGYGQKTLSSAVASAKQDLEKALVELNTLNTSIAKEKIPLNTDIDLLEVQVRDEATKLRDLERERVARSRDQLQLDNNVKARRVEADFMGSVLRDYARGFLNRLHASEYQIYSEKVEQSNARVEAGNLSRAEELAERLQVLSNATDRLEKVIGGTIYEGKALTATDGVVSGKYALLGPMAFFSSTDGKVNGVTNNVTEEVVKPTAIDVGNGEGISQLIKTGTGIVPVDASGGRALVMTRAKDSIGEHVSKGGTVGYCILTLGAFAMLVAIFKLVEILRFAVPHPRQIHSIINDLTDGKTKKAEKTARTISGTAGEMMVIGVENFHRKRRALEELLYEKLLTIRPKLERFLPFLAVTAAAAPLMGLLGTVMGMIKTFKLITEFGTGDAKSLSSGISEALVTTELGLVVAIPILIIHGILTRMARGRIGSMEGASMAFLNGLSTKEDIKEAA